MTLTRITNSKSIEKAANKIESAFKKAGECHETTVGFPGGSKRVNVWWCEESGIWLCPPSEWRTKNRYWFGYGTVSPVDDSALPIAVEINFPREGIDRKVKGSLTIDGSGGVFLCHSGHLGGSLGAGKKDNFLNYCGRDRVSVIDGDGKSSSLFPVAEIGNDRMIGQIAEFVHACAHVKRGGTKEAVGGAPPFFGGADDEFEGSKTVAVSEPYTASCDHGIVRNRLNDLLRKAGLQTGRDRERDLIVGCPSKPEAEFEIKTACDPQHVYTAVGQLFVHSVTNPAESRIVVLPNPVPELTRKALHSLGLRLVEYRWDKTKIHFDGLAALYPGAEASAPVNPPR